MEVRIFKVPQIKGTKLHFTDFFGQCITIFAMSFRNMKEFLQVQKQTVNHWWCDDRSLSVPNCLGKTAYIKNILRPLDRRIGDNSVCMGDIRDGHGLGPSPMGWVGLGWVGFGLIFCGTRWVGFGWVRFKQRNIKIAAWFFFVSYATSCSPQQTTSSHVTALLWQCFVDWELVTEIISIVVS